MRTPSFAAGLIAAAAAFQGTHTTASEGQADPYLHPTTPFEYWKDPCGYPAVIPSEYRIAGGSLHRLLQAEAILVPPSQIEQRTDDPDFYRFTNTEPNINAPGTNIPLTGDPPFIGETRYAIAGRSGYLIGPDIMATAAHANDFNPAAFVAVFDARPMPDPNNAAACIPFDPEYIPSANVFYPRPLAPPIANTVLDYDCIGEIPNCIDYGAYYLSRPTGRRYLRLRESGGISDRDNLAFIGHPFRLATKLVYGVGHLGEATNVTYPDVLYPTFSNFYLLEGMSGAPVYNLDRNYVEISVGSPSGGGCMLYLGDFEGTFRRMYDICDEDREPVEYLYHEPNHDINAGPISTLSALVPTPYLRVEPLEDVTYVLPIGGPPTTSQTTYTATASTHAPGITTISASVAPVSSPAFVQLGTFDATLNPGQSTTIAALANVPPGTACGIYDRVVTIVDQTNNFRDHMRYRFDIGMKAFDVTPSGMVDLYGVTAPSMPDEIAFTVSNTHPTPVTFEVTINEPWAYVSTSSTSHPPSFSLGAVGSPSATKTVKIKLDASAFLLPDGDHPFIVSFAATGACVRDAPTERHVMFHKGGIQFDQTLEVFVPTPTPPGMPVTASFVIPEAFCVSNAATSLETGYSGTIIGSPLADWAPHLTLSLERTGGGLPRSILLWGRHSIPSGWKVPTRYDNSQSLMGEFLLFNSAENLPPTGQTFSQVFGGRQAQGTWTLKVEDDGVQPFSRNESLLLSWQLSITGFAGTCLF